MDQPSSWQDSKVTFMPMPTAATTTFIWGRTTRSAKLPAGPMRGASSSMRVTVHHGMRIRSWSGSGSCTTSKIRPNRCRPMRGVRCVRAKRNRCSRLSTHVSRSWRDGRCPRARSRRRSGTLAISGKRSVVIRRMVGCRSTTTSVNERSVTRRSGEKTLMTFCQPSLRTESANGLKGRAAKLIIAGGERRRRLASTVDPTLIRGLNTPG